MSDSDRAKSLLQNDITCVFVKGDKVLSFCERGISPVIKLLDSGSNVNGFSACDKIVGKAAAMLFVLAGVKAVHGVVMSRAGLEILRNYNIKATYDTLVDKIINRTGTDICPMEKTVQSIDNPQEAYALLKEKFSQMQEKNKIMTQ